MHQELLGLGAERARAGAAGRPLRGRVARRAAPRRAAACSRTSPASRSTPGSAVSFHSAGGERAEVELAARARARAAARRRRAGRRGGGVPRPERYSSLLEQVFGAYGIPYSIDRTLPFGHTGLGRGLLALIRGGRPGRRRRTTCSPTCARPACCACRASPTASRPRCAARARTPPPSARARWERDRWPLEELDRLARRARRRMPSSAELESRLDAPVRRPLPAHAPPS